MAVLHLSLQ